MIINLLTSSFTILRSSVKSQIQKQAQEVLYKTSVVETTWKCNYFNSVRKISPRSIPTVNPPSSRVRLGVGQVTGRQFDRGEFNGGNLPGGFSQYHFNNKSCFNKYRGKTDRNIITRIDEHITKPDQPMYEPCKLYRI